MTSKIRLPKPPPEPPSNRVRVMVVDDHEVVRSGFKASLSVMPDLELVGEAASGEEAIVRCELLKPDVVLMDLAMPGMDGVSATRTIRSKYPLVKVLGLTSFEQDELVQDALRAGAVGYLMKTVTAGELAAAIHAACEGTMHRSPEAAQARPQATAKSREGEPG